MKLFKVLGVIVLGLFYLQAGANPDCSQANESNPETMEYYRDARNAFVEVYRANYSDPIEFSKETFRNLKVNGQNFGNSKPFAILLTREVLEIVKGQYPKVDVERIMPQGLSLDRQIHFANGYDPENPSRPPSFLTMIEALARELCRSTEL